MAERARKPRLTIIGASGQGRVVADIAVKNGYSDIVFLDDNNSVKHCGDYPVIGRTDSFDGKGCLFVAIGNAEARKRLMQFYADAEFPVLVHPNAVIADSVSVGEGSVVMAGAVINPGSSLGKGVIVNTCSSVDHDCTVGDFVHVAVGAHLCGTVKIGELTWIGAGAIISNNISICENCVIGAGAVAVRDIDRKGTYVGVPAKLIGNKGDKH